MSKRPIFVVFQIFAHEMEQLEDAESIQTKLADKHKRMRDIQTQIDGIKADQQQSIDEKKSLDDKIRSEPPVFVVVVVLGGCGHVVGVTLQGRRTC